MAEAKLCAAEGCDKTAWNSRGWCSKHYQRWRIHGDPNYIRPPKPACCVDGCGRAVHAGDLCKMHRRRELRHGDVHHRKRVANGEYRRWLEDHKDHKGDGCLLWPFAVVSGNGYGPSRMMCEIVHGEPPTEEHEAAHSCGNGNIGCVHPDHLRWATHQENQQDMIVHGRSRRGRKNPFVKITEDRVREIRAMEGTGSTREIAKRVGLSQTHVAAIIRRRTWKWLP